PCPPRWWPSTMAAERGVGLVVGRWRRSCASCVGCSASASSWKAVGSKCCTTRIGRRWSASSTFSLPRVNGSGNDCRVVYSPSICRANMAPCHCQENRHGRQEYRQYPPAPAAGTVHFSASPPGGGLHPGPSRGPQGA